MNERELLVDCLRRLNRTGITYYLTGSMASNYWGIPRTTHDLDFVVQLPMSGVPRIAQEFRGDFYIDEAAVRAAFQPPHQFNAIDTRSALKVDFWLSKSEPLEWNFTLRPTTRRCCGRGRRASRRVTEKLLETVGARIETFRRIGTPFERRNQTQANMNASPSAARSRTTPSS